MNNINNVAGRLHTNLEMLCNHRTYSVHQVRLGVKHVLVSALGESVIDVKHLIEVFSADEQSNTMAAFNYLLQIHQMIDESVKVATAHGFDPEHYSNPLSRIKDALVITDLNAPWIDYRAKIDNGDIRAVKFLGVESARLENTSTILIEQDKLNELLSEVTELYNLVQNSNLPFDVQFIILTQLDVIRQAITEYRFKGVSGLSQALERSVGSYALNKERFEVVEKQFQEVGKFKMLIAKLIGMTAFANHATAVAERTVKHLPQLPEFIDKYIK
jgi:hypothetical protein